ncbi:MAG TPA: aldehyde dehydrogenase family protein [Nevskiaceae bacterium]
MNEGHACVAQPLIDHQHASCDLVAIRNPASLHEIVGQMACATAEIVDAAVRSAHAAGRGWARTPVEERVERLAAVVPLWEAALADQARLLTREQGKVLWESVADCAGPKLITRYFASLAPAALRAQRVEDERGTTIQRLVPYGVTVVIEPWNYPVYLAFQHVVPALLAGNTVVFKPPETAPLSVSRALETLSLRLPKGVLNIVPGLGPVVGPALTGHPLVRKVLFTGSTATGRSILKTAADNVKSVSLELGGNDPAVVLPDTALTDELMSEFVRGVFTCTGQVCFAIKRIYVHADMYDAFVDRFSGAVDAITVGNGLDPGVTMGPINNERQFRKLERLMQATRQTSARITTLGRAADESTWKDGYFMRPSVVSHIGADEPLVREEQFGPIVPVLPYTEVTQAVEEANRSEFGLCASVWSDDVEQALAVGDELSAGTVFVNTHRMGASDMTMPFGGMKQSGLGRTHNVDILRECSETQVLAYRANTQKFPGPDMVRLIGGA